ncbi:MAG: HAD family phosphatase [Candidatus Odinarchaeota archaeon]
MFKIFFLDIDGVILETKSIWRYIHESLATLEDRRVLKYRELFFNGKISYHQWAELEASLWKGVSYHEIERVVMNIPFNLGVEETVKKLLKKGIVVALSSGIPLKALRKKLQLIGLEEVYANDLVFEDNIVTGNVIVNVPYYGKHVLARRILWNKGIPPANAMVVGDSENDIPLFKYVSNSIAFNTSSEAVKKEAKIVVDGENLSAILKYI